MQVRAITAIGAGLGVVGAAAIAHATGEDDGAPAGVPVPTDPPVPAPSPKPATSNGPADLAVAWWPQDIAVDEGPGGSQTLRFQTSVANLGGTDAPIEHGDRVEYTVRRLKADGTPGPVVGRNSVPLDRADVHPFPTNFGVEVGHGAQTFGEDLRAIDRLEPATAAIIGAGQAGQAIDIGAASKGEYVLRQEIVRANGAGDVEPFDDARETRIFLDGAGGFLHASSSYVG